MRSFRFVVIALATVALVSFGSGAALATTIIRAAGPLRQMKVVTADDLTGIGQTTFTDIPSMSMTVSVPNGEQGLFLITFSAMSECISQATANCSVQVLWDGNVAVPGNVAWESASPTLDEFNVASMQWLVGPAQPGQHTVKVQAQPSANAVFRVWQRTLSVVRARV